MVKKNKGINMYFLFMLGILLFMMWFTTSAVQNDDYTKQDFKNDINASNVHSVEVSPNAETPTGEIAVALLNGEKHSFYATDVNEIQKLAEDSNVIVRVNLLHHLKFSWYR